MYLIRTLNTAAVALLVTAGGATAAITSSTTHDTSENGLDGNISTTDLLDGLIGHEKVTGDGLFTALEYTDSNGAPVDDNGYHPANPASGSSLHPFGLPTFTNGAGTAGGVDGLLNDFPGDGKPAKRLVYDLGTTADISEIHILGGNGGNDGRVFITTLIRVSGDGGVTWTDLEGNGGSVVYDPKPFVDSNAVPIDAAPFNIPNGSYFQSDPSGTVNEAGVDDWQATRISITDDLGGTIATGVTHISFDFYSVDHIDRTIEDPFFGVNPFTGIDDNILPAGAADFDMDGDVDLDDFNILAANFGTLIGATPATGDADGDMDVDLDDFNVLAASFGVLGGNRKSHPDEPWPIESSLIWEIDVIEAPVPAALPEPGSLALLGLAGAALWRRTRAG